MGEGAGRRSAVATAGRRAARTAARPPDVPPSAKPAATARARCRCTAQIGQPVRAWMPVISPSRGRDPGRRSGRPRCRSPRARSRRTPLPSARRRVQRGQRPGVTSIIAAMITAFSSVPRPRPLRGIQQSRTAALVTSVAAPIGSGVHLDALGEHAQGELPSSLATTSPSPCRTASVRGRPGSRRAGDGRQSASRRGRERERQLVQPVDAVDAAELGSPSRRRSRMCEKERQRLGHLQRARFAPRQ